MEKNTYISDYNNELTEYIPNAMPTNILRIGDIAPQFSADTTFGPITLSDYRGKWLILFSHPGSFTPVRQTKLDVKNDVV
ncbi:Peroxiredoxin [compost metagenome]